MKILDFDLEGNHFIIEADISLRQKADDNMKSHWPHYFFENTQVYKEIDEVVSPFPITAVTWYGCQLTADHALEDVVERITRNETGKLTVREVCPELQEFLDEFNKYPAINGERKIPYFILLDGDIARLAYATNRFLYYADGNNMPIMFRTDDGTIGNKMPLLEYVKKLSPSHPARALLSISDVAPSRTRGSFYTSALTTLRLFTSKSIYAITHTSDFTLADMGSKKQALFVILPDEKTTFYPIASLIVSQQYELLAEAADRRGGRLERRVNFVLDEFGNFTPISDMTNKLTVAAGRGMRYALFVQGFDQLKEKYSDNIANTIKGNCQVWAYLQSDDPETLREMSDKLGSYTTSSYQLSASNGKYTTPSNSQSVSLTERKLLNTDEVRRVKRPHQIITSRDHPAMMYAPDLSQWMFNKMLGLGDMEHNRRLREEREQKRPIITDTKQEIALWNIWIYYQKDIMRRLSQQKGAMGGGLDDD